jgi:hypothetical protein
MPMTDDKLNARGSSNAPTPILPLLNRQKMFLMFQHQRAIQLWCTMAW